MDEEIIPQEATPTIPTTSVEPPKDEGSLLESIQGFAKDIGIPTGQQVEATVEKGLEDFTIQHGKRLNAMSTAILEESLVGTLSTMNAQSAIAERYPQEDGFDMRDHMELLDNVDPSYYHHFQDAHSLAHAEYMAKHYKEQTTNAQYLDKLGWEGVAYRVAGNLIDLPLAVAMTPAGGAFVKQGSIGAKIADKWWLRGLSTGGVEGVIESIKQVGSQRDRTELEMGLSLAGGFLAGTLYKPQYFPQDMADTVQTFVRTGVDDIADTTVDTATIQAQRLDDYLTTSNVLRPNAEVIDEATGNVVQEAIRSKQFSVKYNWYDSPSDTMKAYGNELFDDILNPKLDTITKIEVRDRIENSIASSFSKNFDPLFIDYGKSIYGKSSPAMMRMTNTSLQQEFNSVIGQLYYGIDNEMTAILRQNHPEFVAKAEQAFKQMSHDSYDILSMNKHPKFVDGSITKQDDYMPLSWNKDVLNDDIKNGLIVRGDFEQAVANGLVRKMESLGLQVDMGKVKQASQAFTDTLRKPDPVAGEVNYIIQDNMLKRASDELVDMLGLTDEEADLLLSRITKETKEGTASATKARTPLDLTATYTTETGHTVKLTDYLNTDVQHLWHRYGVSMGGDTALRQLGIGSRKELSELRNQVIKELSDTTGHLLPENQKYLTNFDQTIGHLLGMSGKSKVDEGAWKSTRILHNMIRSSKLGAVWIPMTAELARTTHQVGVKNLIRSLPVLNDMRTAWKGEGFTPYMQEAQLWQSLGNHYLQMPSIAKYDEMLGGASKIGGKPLIDKFENWSYMASEITMQMGGVKSGTSGLEALFSVGSTKKMMDKAFKGTLSKGDYKFFEEYGFSKEMTDRIVSNIKQHADPKYFGGDIMNFKNWDEDVANMFNFGIRRKSYEIIQRSNFGDNIGMNYGDKLIGDTIGGSLAMSLKNYMLVAYNKQLSASISRIAGGGRGMMDTFGNWTYQSSLLSLAYMGKVYATYGGDEDKLEEMLTPEKVAFNTFGMSTFSSFLPPLIDSAYNFGTGEHIMPQGTRGGVMDTILPITYLNDIGTGIGGVADLISPANSATEYQLKKGLSTLPMSNFIFTRWLTDSLAKSLAEEEDDRWE